MTTIVYNENFTKENGIHLYICRNHARFHENTVTPDTSLIIYCLNNFRVFTITTTLNNNNAFCTDTYVRACFGVGMRVNASVHGYGVHRMT